jgi:hypothetical protein
LLPVQGALPRDADFKQHLCADIDGVSLHAASRCGAADRFKASNLGCCIPGLGRVHPVATDCLSAAQLQRLLCGGDLGKLSVVR